MNYTKSFHRSDSVCRVDGTFLLIGDFNIFEALWAKESGHMLISNYSSGNDLINCLTSSLIYCFETF